MKLTLLIASAFVALVAQAQSTQRLSATKANDYGVVYTLPNTVLDITVEAQITEKTPGEFYKYAKKYLNIDDPITAPSLSATVLSATVTPHGVANADERYLVTLKSSSAPYMIVGEGNVPLAINTEKIFAVDAQELPVAREAAPTPLETEAARQVITEDMLRSHSSAKRAELAAEQIYALRQSRTDLITGQADQMPPDGQAMQLVLDNINAQEQALMAMFVGTTRTHTVVSTVRYLPEGDDSNVIIARVSPTKGIVVPSDLSGAPVYLSLKVTEQGELPVNEKGERLPFPKGGVAYRIPGKAEVAVDYDGRTIARTEVEVAQFGVVYGMNPSNFTDKKAPVYVIFNPATGGITEIGPVR